MSVCLTACSQTFLSIATHHTFLSDSYKIRHIIMIYVPIRKNCGTHYRNIDANFFKIVNVQRYSSEVSVDKFAAESVGERSVNI